MGLAGILGHRHPDDAREERSAWAVVDPRPHNPVISSIVVVVAQRRSVATQTVV
jgi:hypothetical protein